MPEEGVETVEPFDVDAHPHTSDGDETATVADRSTNHPDREGIGPAIGPTEDAHGDVAAALARAIDRASIAGRFDVVAQLAREIEARRLATSPNVVRLDPSTRRGRKP